MGKKQQRKYPRSTQPPVGTDYLDGHKQEMRTLFLHGIRAARWHYKCGRYQQMATTIRMIANDIDDVIERAKSGLSMEDSIYELMIPEKDINFLMTLGFETVGDIYYASIEHVDSYRREAKACFRPSTRVQQAFKERGLKWPVVITQPTGKTQSKASAGSKQPSTNRRKKK